MKAKMFKDMDKWDLIKYLFQKVIVEDRYPAVLVQREPYIEENIIFRKRR